MNLEYITLVSLMLFISCEKAQSQCLENEVFVDCGRYCEPTCDNPIIDPNMNCRLDCAYCNCRAGYVRERAGGKCIPENKCPIKCSINEKRNDCASPCLPEPTCQNPNPKPDPDIACITLCVTRCECDKGFIRISPGGRCVLRDNCPS